MVIFKRLNFHTTRAMIASMSDDLAKVGAGAAALGLLYKVLGPSAQVFGDKLAFWTGEGLKHLENILQRALAKTPPESADKPTRVSYRIAKSLVVDAPFCDDEICAEYFGGILASSRTEGQRDDRGVSYLAQINRLSSHQLRCHYVLYRAAQELGVAYWTRFEKPRPPTPAFAYIPETGLISSMSLDGLTKDQASTILRHSLFGLEREGFLGEHWSCTGIRQSRLAISSSELIGRGLIFHPSPQGIELYQWGYGRGQSSVEDFLEKAAEYPALKGIPSIGGCKAIGAHPML